MREQETATIEPDVLDERYDRLEEVHAQVVAEVQSVLDKLREQRLDSTTLEQKRRIVSRVNAFCEQYGVDFYYQGKDSADLIRVRLRATNPSGNLSYFYMMTTVAGFRCIGTEKTFPRLVVRSRISRGKNEG